MDSASSRVEFSERLTHPDKQTKMASYTNRYTLRDVNSNVAADKDRYGYRPAPVPTNYSQGSDVIGRRSGSFSGRSSPVSSRNSGRVSGTNSDAAGPTSAVAAAGAAVGRRSSVLLSPHADRLHAHDPAAVTDFAQEIAEMFLTREKAMVRDPNYMAAQTEINEKMRTILVDWLVDVHLKFKLHAETFFLAIDIVDRYLASTRMSRSQLQLVGVTAILIAAKYEEIWPPEVKDCIHISANTYTREDILKMERSICAALQYKLTTPTPFPMLARLLEVTDADSTTRHVAMYFLEHAVLDYKNLQWLPSQLANASLYLANLTLRKPDPWNFTLQYYSRVPVEDFKSCARNLLDFSSLIANSKYQAIRRKYTSSKYNEVARLPLPAEVPM
jgi:cyclin A